MLMSRKQGRSRTALRLPSVLSKSAISCTESRFSSKGGEPLPRFEWLELAAACSPCEQPAMLRCRGGRRKSKGYVVRPTDLSDVLDPQPGEQQPDGVTFMRVPSGLPPTAAAFAFAAHPGAVCLYRKCLCASL